MEGKILKEVKIKFAPILFKVTNPYGYTHEFDDFLTAIGWKTWMSEGKLTELEGPEDEVIPPSDWPEPPEDLPKD